MSKTLNGGGNDNNILLTPTAMARLAEDVQHEVRNVGRLIPNDVGLVTGGAKITLPTGMDIPTAITHLKRLQELQEKVIQIDQEIHCSPLEGAIALSEAIQEIYGLTEIAGNPGFFGERPPQFVTIETGYNDKGEMTYKTATLGRIQPPRFEEGFLQVNLTGGLVMHITGQVKRKFEDEVGRIMAKVREILSQRSIYRGKATTIDLTWLEEGDSFNPLEHAPKFINTAKIKPGSLILNADTKFAMETHVWSLIRQTELARKIGTKLKTGVLLAGPYGTGKSMTSRETARICVENGWTFIELKCARQFEHAYKLAQLYAPAVLFAEDIDSAVNGERTDEMNGILNTLDGVGTKDDDIITIVTTNHEDKINPAFLRAGRISTIIPMNACDAGAAYEFITRRLGTQLAKDHDKNAIGASCAGFVTSFIEEVLTKALRAAVLTQGRAKLDAHGNPDCTGVVTTDDIVLAARNMRAHQERVNGVKPETEAERFLKVSVEAEKLKAQAAGTAGEHAQHAAVTTEVKGLAQQIKRAVA